jgi:hypothetical protein
MQQSGQQQAASCCQQRVELTCAQGNIWYSPLLEAGKN